MPHQRSNFIFGVEGPAASGKSTMANTVGEELGIKVVDGGWFFRRLAYEALEKQVPLYRDRVSPELIELAQAMPPPSNHLTCLSYTTSVSHHTSASSLHISTYGQPYTKTYDELSASTTRRFMLAALYDSPFQRSVFQTHTCWA